MKILFVCKYNRTRSKIAEAFFNKIKKNKKHQAKSAGLIRENLINSKEINYFKRYKLKINAKPQSLSLNLVKWADLIVIVADNVPKSIFSKKKTKVWKITDVNIKEKRKTKELVLKIESNIKKLIKEID